jgi:hypothetical protein
MSNPNACLNSMHRQIFMRKISSFSFLLLALGTISSLVWTRKRLDFNFSWNEIDYKSVKLSLQFLNRVYFIFRIEGSFELTYF